MNIFIHLLVIVTCSIFDDIVSVTFVRCKQLSDLFVDSVVQSGYMFVMFRCKYFDAILQAIQGLLTDGMLSILHNN